MAAFPTVIPPIIEFAIHFLHECDAAKQVVSHTRPGMLPAMTVCGFTGPGIALVLSFFYANNIHDEATLQGWLDTLLVDGQPINRAEFILTINETIGNFWDNSDYCPETGVTGGIMGLIERADVVAEARRTQIKMFGLDDLTRRIPGTEVSIAPLSFSIENDPCSTFHHATIVVDFGQPQPECFVIDSWQTHGPLCREITARKHDYALLLDELTPLAEGGIDLPAQASMFKRIFGAPSNFTFHSENRPVAHMTNILYMVEIFRRSLARLRQGQGTVFGGKHKKKSYRRKSNKN